MSFQVCISLHCSRGSVMGMQDSMLEFRQSLSPSQITDLRLAASQMTGPKRRAFEAEMALKYCGGNPLLAETLFGWGRQTVALGLAERRTGFICLGAQAAFSGRKRWEDRHQQAAAALRQLADAHAQQDPTFRTSLTYTRLTAQAALQALREQGYSEEQWPSPSTMAEVLNRMGFRLRKVVKAKPQKKLKETDAIFDNIKKRLLLSLGKQRGQRGRKAQKVILRGPCARPPTPFAHSSAPSRCSCGFHRSARLPLGSENTPRSSGAASPCECRVLPGCY